MKYQMLLFTLLCGFVVAVPYANTRQQSNFSEGSTEFQSTMSAKQIVELGLETIQLDPDDGVEDDFLTNPFSDNVPVQASAWGTLSQPGNSEGVAYDFSPESDNRIAAVASGTDALV